MRLSGSNVDRGGLSIVPSTIPIPLFLFNSRSLRLTSAAGQKTDEGLWILKEMRIEWIGRGQSADRTPTYLEIEGVEK